MIKILIGINQEFKEKRKTTLTTLHQNVLTTKRDRAGSHGLDAELVGKRDTVVCVLRVPESLHIHHHWEGPRFTVPYSTHNVGIIGRTGHTGYPSYHDTIEGVVTMETCARNCNLCGCWKT